MYGYMRVATRISGPRNFSECFWAHRFERISPISSDSNIRNQKQRKNGVRWPELRVARGSSAAARLTSMILFGCGAAVRLRSMILFGWARGSNLAAVPRGLPASQISCCALKFVNSAAFCARACKICACGAGGVQYVPLANHTFTLVHNTQHNDIYASKSPEASACSTFRQRCRCSGKQCERWQ